LHALVDAVNQAVYEAVVGTATPCLDRLLVGVSNAANYSRLWLVTDAAVAAGRGRRAACQGVLAVALTSAVANLGLEPPRSPAATRPVGGPPVPDTAAGLHVVFSGHAASAFAFASAMGQAASTLRLHLHVAAATVAYPRVHPGVHHPSDVAIGGATGNLCRGAVPHLAPRAATLR
jgi:membrane-associated phospholipid phosphatase